jgi:hypothetical protein
MRRGSGGIYAAEGEKEKLGEAGQRKLKEE